MNARTSRLSDVQMYLTANGARIPALGLGTWKLDGAAAVNHVAEALQLGYRHIDTAQMYENHREVGQGIRSSGVDRGEIFLTTKLWQDSLRQDAVVASTEQALRDLGTMYLDLLLIHWPHPDVPLSHTLTAMIGLQERGLVRHLGVSNFPPSLLEQAAELAPLVCNQVEYHAGFSQDDLLSAVRRLGLALVAYRPLGAGDLVDNEVLRQIGDGHGKSAAQVALRWLLQQDAVGAIPKAASRRHLRENLDVFGFGLTDQEMSRIHEMAQKGERTVDPEFAPRWERKS